MRVGNMKYYLTLMLVATWCCASNQCIASTIDSTSNQVQEYKSHLSSVLLQDGDFQEVFGQQPSSVKWTIDHRLSLWQRVVFHSGFRCDIRYCYKTEFDALMTVCLWCQTTLSKRLLEPQDKLLAGVDQAFLLGNDLPDVTNHLEIIFRHGDFAVSIYIYPHEDKHATKDYVDPLASILYARVKKHLPKSSPSLLVEPSDRVYLWDLKHSRSPSTLLPDVERQLLKWGAIGLPISQELNCSVMHLNSMDYITVTEMLRTHIHSVGQIHAWMCANSLLDNRPKANPKKRQTTISGDKSRILFFFISQQPEEDLKIRAILVMKNNQVFLVRCEWLSNDPNISKRLKKLDRIFHEQQEVAGEDSSTT